MRSPVVLFCNVQDSSHCEMTHFHTLLSVPVNAEERSVERRWNMSILIRMSSIYWLGIALFYLWHHYYSHSRPVSSHTADSDYSRSLFPITEPFILCQDVNHFDSGSIIDSTISKDLLDLCRVEWSCVSCLWHVLRSLFCNSAHWDWQSNFWLRCLANSISQRLEVVIRRRGSRLGWARRLLLLLLRRHLVDRD